MPLNNTLTLPDNTGPSQNLLTALLNTGNILTVVIFGNDVNAQNAVQIADYRAGFPIAGVSRKVVWMQDTTMLGFLKTMLGAGGQYSPNNIDLSVYIGVSISMSNLLMCLIPINPAPDYLTLENAFVQAGKV